MPPATWRGQPGTTRKEAPGGDSGREAGPPNCHHHRHGQGDRGGGRVAGEPAALQPAASRHHLASFSTVIASRTGEGEGWRRPDTTTCTCIQHLQGDSVWRRNGLIWPIRRFSTKSGIQHATPSLLANPHLGTKDIIHVLYMYCIQYHNGYKLWAIPVIPSHSGGDGSILILYCYSYLIIKFILLFIFSFFFS